MQQLRNEGPKSTTQGLNDVRPVLTQRHWVNVLDNDMERFLRSKGLYIDGQCSVPFGPVDPPLASAVTSLPAGSSPYCSPSLNRRGGPDTPDSIDGHWPNETYSGRNDNFWNETTSVSKASAMDMTESFDDTSIRL